MTLCTDVYGRQIFAKPDYDAFKMVIQLKILVTGLNVQVVASSKATIRESYPIQGRTRLEYLGIQLERYHADRVEG